MTKVLYPGSFDPMTKGHMNIVEQASKLFDEVVIAVLQNSKKKDFFFTQEERVTLIQKLYANNPHVQVISGNGAAVDIALEYQCAAIIRGLRGLTDFDYEIQMAGINKEISNNRVNTICLFADTNHQYISSSMVKEIFSLGKNIGKYVDPFIEEAMKKRNSKN